MLFNLNTYNIFFRYLATGCTFAELHYSFRRGESTVREIVRKVCEVIWLNLKDVYLPLPTEEMWLEIAETFKSRANFPNCIGALDGKHVRIIKPEHSGSLCYNYKNYFSFVLLGLCDANYKFVLIDVGAYGKFGDSTIFQHTEFYRRLESNDLNVPAKSIISATIPTPMPYVIVADEAFSLSEKLMRPYAGRQLGHKQRTFNYRLSRARRFIECTFGILANKWRILHRPLNVSYEFGIDIVKTCCILHNFVREHDGYHFEDTLHTIITDGHITSNRRATRSSVNYRNLFADYFVGEGQVPWQNNLV